MGQEGVDGGDEAGKAARLPRWTRQEILVLIQGKRVAERRGRGSSGSGQAEPKWAAISSYCKRHGVNRGPVQCRKRWSNLAGDFKKIREWEASIREETESFWVMRNDLRRERKLPGFFDREVYDILILDKGEETRGGGGDDGLALALFDSGRAAAVDDVIFSDDQEETAKDVPTTPVSEKQNQTSPQQTPPAQGTNNAKQMGSEAEVQNTQEGKKRKRDANDGEGETASLEHRLMEALEKNGRLLSSQIEAQNTHLQLDREQRNNHVNSLMTVLNKLADSLGRIADKL